MRLKQIGNKEDAIYVVFRNTGGVTIARGDPVVLNLDGSSDGLNATKANTARAHSLMYGVSVDDYDDGSYGEAQVFGFCRQLNLVRATRAATTDSWASQASIAAYNWLTIETVYGGFSTLASSAATYTPFAVLGQSLASYASSASATSDARIAIVVPVKGFVRML